MYSIFSTDELILTWGKYLPAGWVADEDAVDVSRAFDADETVGGYSETVDRLICFVKFSQFIH